MVLVKWKIHGVHASGVVGHVSQHKYFQEGEDHGQETETEIRIRVLAEIVLIEQKDASYQEFASILDHCLGEEELYYTVKIIPVLVQP